MTSTNNIKQPRLGRLMLMVLMLFIGQISFAQLSPPSLRCISVEPNGAVTLTWITTPDTGSVFGGYFIYGSPSANGPFSLYDSVKVHGTQTFTINSVNATNFTFYFYIKTREGCCNTFSAPSDTLRTMRLVTTPLSNEQVRLTWNAISKPLPSTASNQYTVSKVLTPGVYTPFRFTPDTFAFDTNYFCDKFIDYRVTLDDASGCKSISTIDGERFRDTRGPAATSMDSVSIDPLTGNVAITWEPDSSADTQGYVIYLFNGLSYDSIGAVVGINNLFFSYPSALTNSELASEVFTVAAYDSCKNLSPVATNHKTIFLEATLAKCEGTAQLKWSPYVNMIGGISRYEIWYRENGGSWIIDGSTLATVLSYDLVLQTPGANYEVLIHAVGNNGKSSSSNVASVLADIFTQPEFLYVRYASVTGSAVQLRCHADPAADTKTYHFFRANSQNGNFTEIGVVPYDPSGDISFLDANADADVAQRFYKVSARDSCDNEYFSENIAGTVFLRAEGGTDYISKLEWTNYEGWDNPVQGYKILRVYNGAISNDEAGTTSADTLDFTEDVSQLTTLDGNFCYVILAYETPSNQYGFADSAYSNIDCAPQEPVAFVPNAFTPGGLNPIFAPVLRFDDPEGFVMRIYNRWGQLVYETTQVAAGWNGTISGNEAPIGSYLYVIIAKGLNGNEITKRGLVQLIR
ncbi:MAG: gliding motility-associated C-terminal domain-containing protein [Bacteroidota bacterium]